VVAIAGCPLRARYSVSTIPHAVPGHVEAARRAQGRPDRAVLEEDLRAVAAVAHDLGGAHPAGGPRAAFHDHLGGRGHAVELARPHDRDVVVLAEHQPAAAVVLEHHAALLEPVLVRVDLGHEPLECAVGVDVDGLRLGDGA
jgi:hypothetical protein